MLPFRRDGFGQRHCHPPDQIPALVVGIPAGADTLGAYDITGKRLCLEEGLVPQTIRVTVEFVGALAAKAHDPSGLSYGVRLSDIGGPRGVRVGDLLEVLIDEHGEVLSATLGAE